jgi:hypothetical protein
MKHSRISFLSCFSQQIIYVHGGAVPFILAIHQFSKLKKVTTADAWNIIFAMDAGDIDE